MFFSSPSADLKVIIFLLLISLVISVVTYLLSKKILASIFLMSVLSNVVFYLNERSEFFYHYNLKKIIFFIENVWFSINLLFLIILVFNYFKHKNVGVKKN